MRSIARLVAVTFVAALLAATPSDPSEASDDRPCVTRPEFRSVHRGMLKSRVVRIWDGPGQVAEGGRTYRACSGGHVHVDYSFTAHPRVLAKYRIPK